MWLPWNSRSGAGVIGLRGALLVWLLLGLCGCESDQPVLVEVTGRVTLRGQGLTAGSITFHPTADNPFQSDAPSSQLQLDGSFRMRTWPWGDGVPQGSYRVTLSPELAGRIGRARYADKSSTPLLITVPASPMTAHEFRVDDP